MRGPDVESMIELLMLSSASDIRHRLHDQLRAATPSRDADAAFLAFVAEREGEIVGAAKLAPEPAFPGTVSALVAVAEEARGRGIGTALARLIDEGAARLTGADALTCTLRDDLPEGRAFAERFGFAVSNHSVGRILELPAHGEELAESAASTARVARVSVRPARMEDEGRSIMECVGRCMTDMPIPFQPHQDVDLEHARRLIPHDAVIMLAETLDGSAPVVCGVTIVTPQAGTDVWYTVFTGVDVAYRRRGIATAVKAAALLYAYRAGAVAVVTHNDETNRAILRLNQSLGMRPTLGYWGLVRPLHPAPAA